MTVAEMKQELGNIVKEGATYNEALARFAEIVMEKHLKIDLIIFCTYCKDEAKEVRLDVHDKYAAKR